MWLSSAEAPQLNRSLRVQRGAEEQGAAAAAPRLAGVGVPMRRSCARLWADAVLGSWTPADGWR
eukprot:15469818-Alexandrium_andersonii.AAC.1